MGRSLGFGRGLDSAGSALLADEAEGEERQGGEEDDAADYSACYGANAGGLLVGWVRNDRWWGCWRGCWRGNGSGGVSSGEGGFFCEVDGEVGVVTPASAGGFD
jgi:hypothetical protein